MNIHNVLQQHKASNQPWEDWKQTHGYTSGSWNTYVRANGSVLIASDRSLIDAYRAITRRARTVNLPADAPWTFEKMQDLIIKGTEAGSQRCSESADLIRAELNGDNPSWGKNTPYGRAKQEFERIMGQTGSVGGALKRHHDGDFLRDLRSHR